MHPIVKNIQAYIQAKKAHREIHIRYSGGTLKVFYQGEWIPNDEYEAIRVKPDTLLKRFIDKGENVGDKLVRNLQLASLN